MMQDYALSTTSQTAGEMPSPEVAVSGFLRDVLDIADDGCLRVEALGLRDGRVTVHNARLRGVRLDIVPNPNGLRHDDPEPENDFQTVAMRTAWDFLVKSGLAIDGLNNDEPVDLILSAAALMVVEALDLEGSGSPEEALAFVGEVVKSFID